MITLVRIEAEGYALDEVVKDLDAAEAAMMALQHSHEPAKKSKAEFAGPVPLNVGITDEHYERTRSKSGDTYFKGRRVLKFLGVAAWDNYEPPTQPRMVAALSGSNAIYSPTSFTVTT